MSAAAQSSWKPPDADRQPFGWSPPASDRSADPGKELRDKGFFESAWDVVKSVPAAAVEMLTPHSRAEKEAQIQKALQFADRFVSAHQGGDEAAKKAANDELMLALPGGSTIYKAKEGNYAGAAGDIAGMAVLGGVAKAAANPAETAATVRTARTATSGFGQGFKESMSKAPPSKPGQIVGRIVGGVVGHKTIGGLEGSAGGGYAGGEIGSRLPAVPSAVRAGIGKAILRLQQGNLPERPAPAWQRLAEVPEAATAPLADLSAKLQAIIDERNARALERQQTALPPAIERMVTKAKEAGSLTPEQEALASEILQNVEPAPETVPPAAAAPAAPAGLPPMEEILAAPPTRGLNVSPALLEEIAQGLAGKPYNELIPAHQKTVIEMARRMEAGEGTVVPRQPPPEEPPPAAAAAPLEPIPPAPPADTAAPAPEPPPAAPTNVFVKNNRLAKAVRAADRAAELGLTAKDIMQMDRDVFAAKVGEKSISGDTMAMVRDKLRRREADAAKAAAPGPKPTPTAQALTDFEAEKAAKLRAKGEASAPAEPPLQETPIEQAKADFEAGKTASESAGNFPDPVRVQELQNSITEGKQLLKEGRKVSGQKLTEGERGSIERAIANTKSNLDAELQKSAAKTETPNARPYVDQSTLSPNGRVSKRAETATKARSAKELFGEEGLQRPTAAQPTEAATLRQQAQELRNLAARGMKPQAYAKKAAELEAKAAALEAPQTLRTLMEGETPAAAVEALPLNDKGHAILDLDSPVAVAMRKVDADAQRLIDYSEKMRPPSGTIGVGKEGVHEGFTGWATRTLLREVGRGKTVDEAAQIAITELVDANKLQNSRNRDYVTQRWERNGVDKIERAAKELKQAFTEQSSYVPAKPAPPEAPAPKAKKAKKPKAK